MTNIFSRWLPGATLAAWSSILLYFYGTGRISAFLHPSFRGYVLIAGLVLAAMALVFLFVPSAAECCTDNACAHPLSRNNTGKWLTFVVLIIPLYVAGFTAQDGFSKSTILNRGVVMDAAALPPSAKAASAIPSPESAGAVAQPSSADVSSSITPPSLPLPTNGSSTEPAPQLATAPAAAADASATPKIDDYLERTKEGYIVTEVLDLLYAAQDSNLRRDFDGKTVQLLGQFMPDTSSEGKNHRFKAVRTFMTCCAADARPVATLVEVDKLPTSPEMTWVKIIGTATFPVENGRRIAVLKATKVEVSEPPKETMLF